jgi:Family of unknown function (DUF5397)
MQPGFAEAQAVYSIGTTSFVGQVRRFGPVGPAYEVVGVAASGDVEIVVIESGEQLSYAMAEFLADPMAETVP